MNRLHFFLFILFFLTGFLCFGKNSWAGYPSVRINKGEYSTDTRRVTLYLQGPEDTLQMLVSNKGDFSDANWEKFNTNIPWYLDYKAGDKTVYVRFKTKKGVISNIYRDSIKFEVPKVITVDFKINNDDKTTDSRYVNLQFSYTKGVEEIMVSNNKNFLDSEPFTATSKKEWILSSGDGKKTVYVIFRDGNGEDKKISKKITYKESNRRISEGSLIKNKLSNGVYYFGFDGKVHPFANKETYDSWYLNFSNVELISTSKYSQYQLGYPVCVRPGTWLVKFDSGNKVYAVEPGCQLRQLRSEVEAYVLYGSDWQKRIMVFNDTYHTFYNIQSFSVANKAKKIIDKDKDGIDSVEELANGSSDKKVDTDSDGLSDYEEIYYWFTDPNDPDSDGDYNEDGYEILHGYSPLGEEKLIEIPEGTYSLPIGTLFKVKSDKQTKYYYKDTKNIYFVSSSSEAKKFTSNNFQDKFANVLPFKLNFKSSGTIYTATSVVTRPKLLSEDGSIVDM